MTEKEAIDILCANVMMACHEANLDDITYDLVREALDVGLKSIHTIIKLKEELNWQQPQNKIYVEDVLNIIKEEMKE